jgi:5-methylcytosine-specific restriction endonuclease McrA
METKVCSKCHIEKSVEQFHKDKKHGYYSSCKQCKKEYTEANKVRKAEYDKQYRDINRDKKSEQDKKYRQENKEKISEKNKKYYSANKEAILVKNKEHYQTNKEKIGERTDKYRKTHLKKFAEIAKQYRRENKEKVAEIARNYRVRNLEKVKEQERQYRQTEKWRISDYNARIKRRSHKYKVAFTPHERRIILDRDNWTCQSCGIKVHDRSKGDWNTPDKANIDHIVPISKGGNSKLSNLQTLCRTCNLTKNNKQDEQLKLSF